MKIAKKGELTTQQIVIIIIIIASFCVLLYFLLLLNPGETTAKQVCYNSVVLLSKSAKLVGSLDCKTNYLCISGGDECTDFNPTDTIKVDISKKDEIFKALADAMSDCWWMFGEGERDYSSGFLGSSTHCAVCSKIKFDSKIQNSLKEITPNELYDYMISNPSSYDSSRNYLLYLYGVNKAEGLNSVSLISTSNEYSVITGIDPTFPYMWGDKNLPVYILKSDEVNSNKTGCQIFDITKSQ